MVGSEGPGVVGSEGSGVVGSEGPGVVGSEHPGAVGLRVQVQQENIGFKLHQMAVV